MEGDKQKQRWKILGYNSLFGYQFSDGIQPDHFAICFCDTDMPAEIEAQIRTISGATSLRLGDFIGHGYFTIHMSDYDKITPIFNAMLEARQWFRTRNAAEVGFNAERGDCVFSDEIMERKYIERTRDILKEDWGQRLVKQESSTIFKWQALHIWNYRTEEGKAFCHQLRALKNLPPPTEDDHENYFRWGPFCLGEGERQPLEDAVLEKECMICLDAVPDTMVEPCGHVVVCQACSTGLRNTADAHTCVQCRRPIANIINV